MKKRGLKEVKLVVSDACLGIMESLGDFYPQAKWQRLTMHFYRNVFSAVPRSKVKEVTRKLKAIHTSDDKSAAHEKARDVIKKLETKKLSKAAQVVRKRIGDKLAYYDFPDAHWKHIRANNPLECILREVRPRTRMVGAFLDENFALMLVAARLRHISGTCWGTRHYLNMDLLKEMEREEIVA